MRLRFFCRLVRLRQLVGARCAGLCGGGSSSLRDAQVGGLARCGTYGPCRQAGGPVTRTVGGPMRGGPTVRAGLSSSVLPYPFVAYGVPYALQGGSGGTVLRHAPPIGLQRSAAASCVTLRSAGLRGGVHTVRAGRRVGRWPARSVAHTISGPVRGGPTVRAGLSSVVSPYPFVAYCVSYALQGGSGGTISRHAPQSVYSVRRPRPAWRSGRRACEVRCIRSVPAGGWVGSAHGRRACAMQSCAGRVLLRGASVRFARVEASRMQVLSALIRKSAADGRLFVFFV